MRNKFPSRPVMERFEEKYIPVTESGCWVWTGSVKATGYASFWVSPERRHMEGHRFAYEHFVGPIPAGKHLDHLCRVRCCVNPAHLEPVTVKENILRGESPAAEYAKRDRCMHGHKLVPENCYEGIGRGCRTCNRLRQLARYERDRICKREWRPQRTTKVFLEKHATPNCIGHCDPKLTDPYNESDTLP